MLTAAGLLLLWLLAWTYLLQGAGLGPSPLNPAGPGPAMDGIDMAGMDMGAAAASSDWTPRTWLLSVAMWWVMMAAMMLTSAAPTILLYARVRRHQGQQEGTSARVAPDGAFTGGYLLAWLGFALAATATQWALQRTGLLDPATMGLKAKWLSAAVLSWAVAQLVRDWARLRLVAALRDSILQGELMMSQANFHALFPDQEGYQVMLVETAPERAAEVAARIEEGLSDFGGDATSTAERLSRFHRVENTYLSTFQTLGGLGLLLGTVGLATVLLLVVGAVAAFVGVAIAATIPRAGNKAAESHQPQPVAVTVGEQA